MDLSNKDKFSKYFLWILIFLKIYGMENTEFDFCTIAHVKVGLMVGNYVSVRGSRFGEIIW